MHKAPEQREKKERDNQLGFPGLFGYVITFTTSSDHTMPLSLAHWSLSGSLSAAAACFRSKVASFRHWVSEVCKQQQQLNPLQRRRRRREISGGAFSHASGKRKPTCWWFVPSRGGSSVKQTLLRIWNQTENHLSLLQKQTIKKKKCRP